MTCPTSTGPATGVEVGVYVQVGVRVIVGVSGGGVPAGGRGPAIRLLGKPGGASANVWLMPGQMASTTASVGIAKAIHKRTRLFLFASILCLLVSAVAFRYLTGLSNFIHLTPSTKLAHQWNHLILWVGL